MHRMNPSRRSLFWVATLLLVLGFMPIEGVVRRVKIPQRHPKQQAKLLLQVQQEQGQQQQQRHRRLDSVGDGKGKGKSSKGKGKGKGKGDSSSDSESDSESENENESEGGRQDPNTGGSATTTTPVPSPSPSLSAIPTISSQPTLSPTISSAPSEKPTSLPTPAPSSKPSAVPTKNPTSLPTLVPSVSPSASPTDAPSSPPSASPTISLAPTRNPYTTTTSDGTNNDLNNNALEESYTSVVSSCSEPIPTQGISSVARQLVQYQFEVQIDRMRYNQTANQKVAQVEPLVHKEIASILLGTCDFANRDGAAVVTRVDTYRPDVVADILRDGSCAAGRSCWVVQADFTLDIFYHLVSRRSLQDGAEIKPFLSDSTLLGRLGNLLQGVYQNLDTLDGSTFRFRYFTNAYVLESTGDGNVGEDGFNADGLAGNAIPAASSDKGNGLVSGFAVGCASLVLIAVAILAVQRRRPDFKKDTMRHMALEDMDEDEIFDWDDPYRVDGRTDRDVPTNPKTSHAEILADLQSLHQSHMDQEMASIAMASAYSSEPRKVYVLSDAEDGSDFLGGSSAQSTLRDPPSRFAADSSKDPIFLKATLQSNMKDLQRPLSDTSSATRSYVAEDTVML